jgi:hypothetical protein
VVESHRTLLLYIVVRKLKIILDQNSYKVQIMPETNGKNKNLNTKDIKEKIGVKHKKYTVIAISYSVELVLETKSAGRLAEIGKSLSSRPLAPYFFRYRIQMGGDQTAKSPKQKTGFVVTTIQSKIYHTHRAYFRYRGIQCQKETHHYRRS